MLFFVFKNGRQPTPPDTPRHPFRQKRFWQLISPNLQAIGNGVKKLVQMPPIKIQVEIWWKFFQIKKIS
jgi:hypothetical protein